MKPCPFCGSTDITTSEDEYGNIFASCRSCHACGPTHNESHEEARKLWNKRAAAALEVSQTVGEVNGSFVGLKIGRIG